MKNPSGLSVLIFIIILGLGIGLAYYYNSYYGDAASFWIGVIFFIIALFISASIKIAKEWERAIVLRLGKYYSLRGPGIFLIIPIIDSIAYWIDLRVITTPFNAEKALTKDTVPVDVDAVLFWKVENPKKAALEVEYYKEAISWASQTALRDVIGKTMLSDMLEGREKIDVELQKIIEKQTKLWGINVNSVEIRDILIPDALQNAMSMQAQAERERQARVILGDSEWQIAEKFEKAAKKYVNNPTALHLRAMNMLYDGLKEKATLVIVPSTAVDTMQLGGVAGVTALSKELDEEMKNQSKNDKNKLSDNKMNFNKRSEDKKQDYDDEILDKSV